MVAPAPRLAAAPPLHALDGAPEGLPQPDGSCVYYQVNQRHPEWERALGDRAVAVYALEDVQIELLASSSAL